MDVAKFWVCGIVSLLGRLEMHMPSVHIGVPALGIVRFLTEGWAVLWALLSGIAQTGINDHPLARCRAVGSTLFFVFENPYFNSSFFIQICFTMHHKRD